MNRTPTPDPSTGRPRPQTSPPGPDRSANRSTPSQHRPCLLPLSLGLGLAVGAPETHAQLLLQLHAPGASDTRVASNVVLHVPAGSTPSPFLPPGPFSAEWSGWLQVELRGDFQFQATHSGPVTLSINNTPVLSSSNPLGETDWSRPVRLRKGTNHLRITLTRTNTEEVGLRLSWKGRGLPPSPLPPTALLSPDDALHQQPSHQDAARRGRDLFLTHRCGHCHDAEVPHPVPELSADAPSFAGIGSRRTQRWLARWILHPQDLRANATMPRLLHEPDAKAEAEDLASWLASLSEASTPETPAPRAVAAMGRALVDALLCRACHVLPGDAPSTNKTSLTSVRDAFRTRTVLADYLQAPERQFKWSRMPNFRLSAEESAHIAAFLYGPDPTPEPTPDPIRAHDPQQIARGKALARARGCLQCHADPEPRLATPGASNPAPDPGEKRAVAGPPVRTLARDGIHANGCLADGVEGLPRRAPVFALTPSEREDLRVFLASDLSSLGRDVTTDFVERWTRNLRCGECHGPIEGVPRLEGVGDKLRPEWIHRRLAGTLEYKPRPWLESRMPAYPAFAERMAEGFAALAGRPARSPAETPADPEAAAVGRKLVSASAGFACVTCHAIGPFSASAVFEAPGVNLAHANDRLLPDFFIRWVRNPQSFDPTTKMPLYFDEEGNSALSDYYGGDGPKTLRALWEYLRPGPQITPPEP